jgi:elongation factor P
MEVSELSKGMAIEYNGELYLIEEYEHSKRGRGDAIARTKLRHLKTGRVFSKVFQGGEVTKVKRAYLEERPLQYLYSSGGEYHFMDSETYDQFSLTKEQLSDVVYYLKENMELKGLFYEGSIVKINLPTFVELEVVETEPGVKGDTAAGGDKVAILETGLEIKVPLFIKVNDIVKIDTRTAEYIERVGRG